MKYGVTVVKVFYYEISAEDEMQAEEIAIDNFKYDMYHGEHNSDYDSVEVEIIKRG